MSVMGHIGSYILVLGRLANLSVYLIFQLRLKNIEIPNGSIGNKINDDVSCSGGNLDTARVYQN